jgi:LysR family transcriptional regulator, regulator for bpeEF and oprC
VVDLGGFTRAAENLRLTPSGVSRILSRLEARLGVRLLNRTTRSLSLTDEGAAYYRGELELLLEEYFIDFLAELFASTPANLNGRKRR